MLTLSFETAAHCCRCLWGPGCHHLELCHGPEHRCRLDQLTVGSVGPVGGLVHSKDMVG